MPEQGAGASRQGVWARVRKTAMEVWTLDEMLGALAIGAALVLLCQLWSTGTTELKDAFALSKSWVGLAIMLHTGKQGANALKATEDPIQWPAMATLAAQLLAGVSLMLIPVSG